MAHIQNDDAWYPPDDILRDVIATRKIIISTGIDRAKPITTVNTTPMPFEKVWMRPKTNMSLSSSAAMPFLTKMPAILSARVFVAIASVFFYRQISRHGKRRQGLTANYDTNG